MPYLILQDYYTKIQDQNLQQVLSDEDKYRLIGQSEALAEIKSYLSQKFDIADEFRETVVFSFDETYKAKQLVYLDADAYSPASTYALNALALQNGSVYYCSTAIDVAEAFTGAKWTLLGDQYALFYVALPAEEFNHEGTYSKDDTVFWKDKVHTCLRDTLPLSQSTKLQYSEYDDLPGINEYPDAENQTQWNAGVSYSVTETMPDDEVYTEGDNRNPMLVGMNVVMAIHKLSPRITPFNVPDVWVKNYDDAITWLKKCAKGDVTLDAPLRQPSKKRIRWGSSIKNNNNY